MGSIHPPKALIFDLNGTMINDMEYHTRAWQHIVNHDLGGNFTWAEVKQNMYGKNEELLVRMFGAGHFSDEEMKRISIEKERHYQQAFLPELALLPGLNEFLEKAYQREIPMAIASAAIMFNIDFVLDNLNIRHYFKALVSADDVTRSKPFPETFLKAAKLLDVDPIDCVVLEDAPKGVEAAQNAGMPAIVFTTTHGREDFEYLTNIIHYAQDYTGDFFKTFLG